MALGELQDDNRPPAAQGQAKSAQDLYQKLTQREHILLRPDSYIGSLELLKASHYVLDAQKEKIVRQELDFSSGLFKIFDEVLVNAMDHAHREESMTKLDVTIDRESGRITVLNNGPGIPTTFIRKEKCHAPELIFGHLLTSSNYDDSEERTVGGRNGYGAKLTNIYSSAFNVETVCDGKFYHQEWSDNMSICNEPEVRCMIDAHF